jgi:hypothetical protein
MLRLLSPSRTSPLRNRSRRSTSLLAAALLVSAASPAWAKKKKDDAATTPPPAAAATGPIAPEPDSMGRVHFGPQSGEGLGRLTVKGAPEEKIQVFLEGRYFGTAPMTIYSVPKGDYIVEGKYPDGREVNRPINVAENEEATVDLFAAKPTAPGASKGNMFGGDISPTRLKATKILLVASAVSLAVGIAFGILELRDESDYTKTPPSNQAKLDDISSSGRRDALLANVGFAATGAFLVAAAIAGYPMIIKPTAADRGPEAMLIPSVTGGAAGGTLVVRF